MRNIALDILRVIACLMVVFMHSPMPGMNTPGAVLSGLSYITSPCIGLFFMISGSLLLGKANDKDAASFDLKNFFKKRFTKVVIPFAFWYALGEILSYCGIRNSETGILWFMTVLCGLYLLTPILYRWLSCASKSEVELYLLIWGVSLCYPFLKLVVPMNDTDKSWIYYFHGYAGYYVLGYYLSMKENCFNSKKSKIVFGLLFILISILSPVIVLLNGIECDFYSLFWYLSITVVFQCIVWWSGIKALVGKSMVFWGKSKIFLLITEVSRLSFGVYLVHILVMWNILWNTEWLRTMNGILQIIVCAILTFVISIIMVYVISKVKYLKALVGF